MKNYLLIAIAFMACFFCASNVSAQSRFKVSDGIYVVTYGNVTVIENDNTQQTVKIKVAKKDDTFYDIFCGNKYVKSVAKGAIKEGIRYAITYASGGSLTWLTRTIIDVAVEKAYDATCDYFK